MGQKLEVRYGLFMAVSMVVGQMVGSGIFFKVDDVLASTNGNVYAGVMGFIIVGISVVFSAASMANYAIFAMGKESRLMWAGFISLCFCLCWREFYSRYRAFTFLISLWSLSILNLISCTIH